LFSIEVIRKAYEFLLSSYVIYPSDYIDEELK